MTDPAPEPAAGGDRQGGVRPLRFLLVTAPATVACVAVVAGIVLGYLSVAIAGSRPLDMTTSHGTGDSMRIAVATDDLITGLDTESDPRAAAKITVEAPSLDDLCLLPRVTLPLIGEVGWLRINSDSQVDLGSVVLAAGRGQLEGLSSPSTTIGETAGDYLPGAPGAFSVYAEGAGPGEVIMDGLEMQAYGMILDKGMMMRSLSLTPGRGEASCSDG